ncbi:MAG: hypothetical protein CL536_00860 [Alcaligenaceae bacterium]|nr:hypothetical protein [Alcaligenaceae bacterium]
MSDLFRKMERRSNKWNERNDCTVKALAIATGKTYEQAHGALALRGRNFRKGTTMSAVWKAARDLGFTEKEIYCRYFSERDHLFAPDKERAKKMRRSRWAKGKTIKSIKPYLPKRGAFLISTSTHVLCVRAGEVHDWTSDRRHRIVKVHHITRAEVPKKK